MLKSVPLAEHVAFGLPDHFPRRAVAAWDWVAADQGGRYAVELARDQLGGGSQLIGDANPGRAQLPAVCVQLAYVVDDGMHASDADRHFRVTGAPGAAKRVADNHG